VIDFDSKSQDSMALTGDEKVVGKQFG